VYLNKNIAGTDEDKVKKTIIEHLMTYPAISAAFELQDLQKTPIPADLKTMFTNGYNQS
jgi:hypothetical protein